MSDLPLPTLPLRWDSQNLHAYVRAHLDRLEHERWRGIPYLTLAETLNTLGFTAVGVRTLQTAVYRARHSKCKKAARAAGALGTRPLRTYMGQRHRDREEIERHSGTPAVEAFGSSISKSPVFPPSPWQEPPLQGSTADERRVIARRLRELARPPGPGERDPLD